MSRLSLSSESCSARRINTSNWGPYARRRGLVGRLALALVIFCGTVLPVEMGRGGLAVVGAVECAAEGPGGADQQSIEQYGESLKQKFIPKKIEQARGREEEVKAVIEQSQDKTARWENWHGAASGTAWETMQKDLEEISGGSFAQCQPSNMRHSFPQILTPPIPIRYRCLTYYKYAGIPSGVAFKCRPSFFCGCKCKAYEVVDYYFPTAKLDSSEQMYQSKYLDKSLVEGSFIPMNEAAIASTGVLNGTDILASRAITIGNLAKRNIFVSGQSLRAIEGDQAVLAARDAYKRAIEQDVDLTKDEKKQATDVLFSSPDQANIYTRNIFEPLNLSTATLWWIPHIHKFHFFGTDLPGGFIYSKHLSLSSVLERKYAKFFQSGRAGACVAHNVETGKSPTDRVRPAPTPPSVPGGYQSLDSDELCLTKVGERFPLTESGRMNITDRTYRGLAKDLDLFAALLRPDGDEFSRGGIVHSYKETVDKLLVLRNEALKQEQPNCAALPKIVKYNVSYERANVKELKKGGNNTHEVFTAFRGAWGLKGVSSSYFSCGGAECSGVGFCPCPGGVIKFQGPKNGANNQHAAPLDWPSSNCFRTE